MRKLYHFAYPCRDAEETRKFYEGILGLALVNCMQSDIVPSTGEEKPYAHIFFQMGDGSYVAFFDLGTNEAPLPSENTPRWVQHLALEVDDLDQLVVLQDRLRKAGVETTELVDHGFIKSIYFFDPNGLRLELTIRTEEPGYLESAAAAAHGELESWNKKKARLVAS
ncbi:VOC family protein [Amycolatopsis sp. GM8]|uniref:VOC family protein n=1 Tax=Amycolatopsis sp. GM8 TaxID=2896530 RepID=UPI001F2E38EA|nr:VOC family protein [Amycolatopsis sp. GM8]